MKPGEVIGKAMLVDGGRIMDETTVLLGIGSTTRSIAPKLVKPLVPKPGQGCVRCDQRQRERRRCREGPGMKGYSTT